MAYETVYGLEISTETDSSLCAEGSVMEEVADDQKLKPWTVFSGRHEMKPKSGSTYKQSKLDSL